MLTRLAMLPWVGTGLLLALLMAADTDAGRGLLARALSAAAGGQVMLHGLGGELPFRPRIERLELADADGVWLRARDLSLALRPAALLRGELDLRALTMDELLLARLPGTGAGDGARPRLPVPVRLRRLVIARLVHTGPGPSLPALAVTGSARLGGASTDADLLLTVPGRGDTYHLRLAPGPQGHRLSVDVREAADGALTALASAAGVPRPPGFGDWTLSGVLEGTLSAAAVDAEIASGPYRAELGGVLDLAARSIAALDGRVEVAAMRVQPPGVQGTLGWDGITARVELAGPLQGLQGRVRIAARGVALSRAAGAGGLAGSAPQPAAAPSAASALLAAGSLDFEVAGPLGGELLDLAWALGVDAPTVLGSPLGVRLDASGHAAGTLGSPSVDADLMLRRSAGARNDNAGTGSPAAAGADAAGDRVQGRLTLEPGAHRGRLVLSGGWLGQPLALDASLAPMPGGGLDLRLRDGRWSGINLGGRLRLATGARLPTGNLVMGIARLEQAAPLLVPLLQPHLSPFPAPNPGADWWARPGGRLELRLELGGDEQVRLGADGAGLRLPGGVALGSLALQGALRDPVGAIRGETRGDTRGELRLADLSLAGVRGDLDVRARGPLDALDVGAAGRLRLAPASAGDVRLALAGLLRPQARRLELDSLRVDARDRRLTLLAPAAVDFAAGVGLETFRLGLSRGAGAGAGSATAAGGVLELSGQVAPRLSVDGRLASLDLAAVSPWLPAPLSGIRGLLDADAQLAGSASAPTGRLTLDGRGLAVAGSRELGLPAATARLTLTLEEREARLAAEAQMDERARLALDGRIGRRLRRASGPLDLRAAGQLDLSLLDGWLGAGGRRAEGRVGLDLRVAGTRAAPRLDGRLEVADAAWRDRRLGLWLEDIAGRVRVSEDRLRIERLGARAGAGTLSLDGGVDQWASGRSLDLRLRARGAEPIRLDLLRLRGDADLSLTGSLSGDLSLTGDVRLDEVDVQIPAQLPADVPTLEVVELGERRQPRPAGRALTASGWPARLDLDVGIDAPGAIQVRGRNVDAELGGSVRLRGPASAPVAEGDFALLRGEYELIGQRLAFTRGRIGLDGADLLDPTLDLEARSRGAGAVGILAVEGRARAPVVVLRGEPPMSDDEVLSRLLFGVPPNRLSALQLTRLGLAATSIAGVGGGSGLLDWARDGFGLSRLRVDGDRRGGTVLEGGRQLSERVYLGARQVLERSDPRAVLGLQLAPQIRFESDVGSRGAGAGAAFELEY